VGSYAAAFDLVSSEYGWTDEEINNLTLDRFWQVVAAISTKQYLQLREQKSLVAWQTRQLATYMVGGWMTDSKKAKQEALNSAASIAFDDIESEQLKDADVEVAETDLTWTPDQVPDVVTDAQPGSFERFMGTMGDRSRWR